MQEGNTLTFKCLGIIWQHFLLTHIDWHNLQLLPSPSVFTRLLQLQYECELRFHEFIAVVYTVWQSRWLNLTVLCVWCWQKQHGRPKSTMKWALLYLYKRGLVWEPPGEPPWYSYATASSDCKVGKEIELFRELVYLMNGTLLRVALIGDPNYVPHKRHFGEKPLAQPFCWQCGRILWTILLKLMHSL